MIYGVKMLRALKGTGVETHLIISEAGQMNIAIETDYRLDQVLAMADHTYDNRDVGGILSGSQKMGKQRLTM